jgi:hypothetical protein
MNQLFFLTQATSSNSDEFTGAMAAIAIAFVSVIGIVVAIAIWQGMATWRARMHIAREEAYRKLAENAEATNSRTADLLASIKNDLADLRTRTAELERMMKEVG